ncbi:MAG TPA: twin-arginine translocase TatA/TatE family subunit [Terracidiphilus sp.]|jgi:sec-independent protein translocase protein TatB|nr:twin-arginine translocase TatA/TatE family subunit [Terracidiphilus sp.]
MVAPPQIELGNLGMADSLILMVLALVVFGPRRLPQIGRQIGKLMYEFRKASNDFKFQMEEELRLAEDADRRKKEEAQRQLTLGAPTQTIEAQAAIGATEQASVSASPSLYPGQPATPAENPPEMAVEPQLPAEPQLEAEPQIPYPRIQPPSIGEQVPAARPNAATPAEEAAEPSVAAEASVDDEPASNEPAPTEPAAVDPAAAAAPGAYPQPASEPSPTEPVTHHG